MSADTLLHIEAERLDKMGPRQLAEEMVARWPDQPDLPIARLARALLEQLGANEPEHTASDGTTRKTHYGAGRQPWDDIKELGWAPEFAASNVLKYLRRTKDPLHSRSSARWYFHELQVLAADLAYPWRARAGLAHSRLLATLTEGELALLLAAEHA